MVSFPPCKINLGLHVVSKRSDGFHDIETCFYPVPFSDILEIIKTPDFSFSQSGISVPGLTDENICIEAYHLLKKDFDFGNVKIHLHKIIPIGAGLGGGSSNAAFTLRLLNIVFDLKISREQLSTYAAQLGSDCAFFIGDEPMIGSGRGEILSPAAVQLKGYYVVLVKPDLHISTAEAYSGINPRRPDLAIEEIIAGPVSLWSDRLKNDFEESMFKKYPVIGQLKEKLYSHGALYASMSGSGSSVYGIFKKPVELKSDFPGMTYWSGELK